MNKGQRILSLLDPSLVFHRQPDETERLLDAALPEWRAYYRAWLIASLIRVFAFLALLIFVAYVGGHTLSGIVLAAIFVGMVLFCRVLRFLITLQPLYEWVAFMFLSNFIAGLWFQMNLGTFLISLVLYAVMIVAYIYKEGCVVTLKKSRSSIGV